MPEFRESKVHSCLFQQRVVEQKFEPSPRKKCRCRQLVTFENAKEQVRQGVAKWVVEKRRRVERELICDQCRDESPFKISCPVCKGLGRIHFVSILDDPGFDIVKLAHHTKSTRVSTPRVPTIESKHILRAYVSVESRQLVQAALSEREGDWGNRDEEEGYTEGRIKFAHLEPVSPKQRRSAAARIEEYGQLVENELKKIGSGTNPEPGEKRVAYPPGSITFSDGTKNKSWWWDIEGRATNYGRVV